MNYCFISGGNCAIILETNSLILASFFSTLLVIKFPVPEPCHTSSLLLASIKSTNKTPSVVVETELPPPQPQPGPQPQPQPGAPQPQAP